MYRSAVREKFPSHWFIFLAHLGESTIKLQITYHPSVRLQTFHIFFFSRTTELISTKLGIKHPLVKGIQAYSNERPWPFSKGRYSRNSENILTKFDSPEPLGQFNKSRHKASLGKGDSSLFKCLRLYPICI